MTRPAAWRAASVVGQDRILLADPRGLAPRDSWAGAAMASGAWWARVIQAARRFGGYA